MEKNCEVYLVSRPGIDSPPSEANFGTRECDPPALPPPENSLVIKTLFLSVDPAQRCQLNESTGVEYLKPHQIGERINGLGGVGVVVAVGANCSNFSVGDIVTNSGLNWPWVEYFTVKEDEEFSKVEKGFIPEFPLTYLGLVGLTSYLGVKEKGKVKAGDVVVVSGAAGACGTLAGQFAKLDGAVKVIGVCGSDEKCYYICDELGFTDAVNYKKEDFEQKLAEVCKDGVDVYFDNVGGEISRKIIVDHMKPNGRVVLCGQIADYNKDVPYPPPIPDDMKRAIQEKSIERDRFLVLSYQDKFPESLESMKKLYRDGKIRVASSVKVGIEQTGTAFVSMMNGGNTGKQLVKVASMDSGDSS